MTRRCGIDTSVLVRLLTGDPEAEFVRCRDMLATLSRDGCEVVASNQVIGEAYVAVRHHYGATREDARGALLDVFRSGAIRPRNGRSVLDALGEFGGAGLLDRLIADDYRRGGLEVLTLDRRMAQLPGARSL